MQLISKVHCLLFDDMELTLLRNVKKIFFYLPLSVARRAKSLKVCLALVVKLLKPPLLKVGWIKN